MRGKGLQHHQEQTQGTQNSVTAKTQIMLGTKHGGLGICQDPNQPAVTRTTGTAKANTPQMLYYSVMRADWHKQ